MRAHDVVQSVRSSIFVKLLLIFAFTALLIFGFLYGMADHFSHVHDDVWNKRNGNRMAYGNMLVERIGIPPDFKKADEIVAQTGMRIRIEGEGYHYTHPAGVAEISDLVSKAHRCVWGDDAKVMTHGGRIYILLTRSKIQYLFSYENDNFFDERPEWWPILLSLILIVLLFNYLFTRWLFQPISWLSEGVKRVQRGDLTTEIKTRENDELGTLAKSFNQMTKDISVMLESKEQLLLDVSHELRSPLTRMKVALELEDETMASEIKKNVRDLEVMISELLESARLDTPQGRLMMSLTPVKRVIDRVVSQLKDERPGISVSSVPKELIVMMDEPRVETVLRNLLENALKYSKDSKSPVEVNVLSPAPNEVWMQVRDFGCGIPESEQNLVFEPFYRVDKSRVRETGGYGLGLALCKKIMVAHQGKIELSSSVNSGTVFTLKFISTGIASSAAILRSL